VLRGECMYTCVCVRVFAFVQISKTQDWFTYDSHVYRNQALDWFWYYSLAMMRRMPAHLWASNCASGMSFAKEPLITGLFCGKGPIKIRHPLPRCHPVQPQSILKHDRFIYECTCIYVHMYNTCKYTYFGYIYLHAYVYTYANAYTHIHVYVHIFTGNDAARVQASLKSHSIQTHNSYICAYISVHVYVYIYIYICIYA